MGFTIRSATVSLLAATLFLCSCATEKDNVVATDSPTFKSSSKSPAHPALTYIGLYRKGNITDGNSWNTVAVADSDGAHPTNVFISSTASEVGTNFSLPRWAPSGGSIAYIEWALTNGGDPRVSSIKAIDVAVGSNGTPIGSNSRTIYSSTVTYPGGIITGDITGLAWCSVGGTGRLAFIMHTTINGSRVSALYTISQNGGTPTLITSISDGVMKSPTWSPDDSKIGVFVNSSSSQPYNWHLQVVSSVTGTVLEDDALTALAAADHCEWAHTGNTIAFDGTTSTLPKEIYYIDFGSLTGPYTQHAPGTFPTWSPNNAALMVANRDATTGNWMEQKINAFGTTATTVINPIPFTTEYKWKR